MKRFNFLRYRRYSLLWGSIGSRNMDFYGFFPSPLLKVFQGKKQTQLNNKYVRQKCFGLKVTRICSSISLNHLENFV